MTSAGFYLSPQQQHVWASAPDARTQIAVLVEGAVNEAALQAALGMVAGSHESLHTGFQRQAGMKMPFQVVLEDAAPIWSRGSMDVDLREESRDVLQGLLEQESAEAMPLVGSQLRAAWYSGRQESAWWVLTAHAAVADGSSLRKVVELTLEAYAGESGGAETLPYVQFAQWQNDLLTSEDEAGVEGLGFWAKAAQKQAGPVLSGVLTAGDVPVFAVVPVPFVGDVEADVLLAAWAVVLARWSGYALVELGVALEGREYEELAELVGAVARTVPLTVTLEGEPRFAEVVAQVATARVQASGLQEYYAPGRQFVAEFAAATLMPAVTLKGSRFTGLLARSWGGSFAVKLQAAFGAGGVGLELQYRADRLSLSLAAGLVDSLGTLLTAAVEGPEQVASELPLLSRAGRAQVLEEWNETAADCPAGSLVTLWNTQARRSPASAAVQCGAKSMTYAELYAQSNQLARALGALGVGRGSLVGLCVSRTERMMLPVLAILMAGAAYVPLSADQPKARTELQMGGLAALVTEAGFLGQLPAFAGPVLLLDSPGWEQQSKLPLETVPAAEDLAYVLYTSGSTGTPKGVSVRHGSLVNYVTAMIRALDLDEEPLVYATVSTLSADLGNTVLYPALLTGGCLHVVPQEVAADAQLMAAYQAEHGIDVLKIVPSHLAALVHGAGHGVLPRRFLITGGEALKPALLAQWNGSCEVVNHYGPTETTVGSLMLRLRDYDWRQAGRATIPIGRPLANTQAYVLDARQQPVPVGVAGELYLAGAGVSDGYLGNEALTRERFLPNPFGEGRMYRTGDQVRWLAGGLVEFVGRMDDQVKIRGFRVEPGEVEAVLAAQPGVRQCAVLALPRKEDPESFQLVAYVVLDRQHAATSAQLREVLKTLLPDYMVPSAVVELAKLPLTSNGKVDRKALPAPEERIVREYQAPATETELQVARIWSDMLKVARISRDENFFDLGGHSLLATQVISRVREGFRLEIALRTLFEAPVLQAFSAALDQARSRGELQPLSAPIQRAARQAYRG